MRHRDDGIVKKVILREKTELKRRYLQGRHSVISWNCRGGCSI